MNKHLTVAILSIIVIAGLSACGQSKKENKSQIVATLSVLPEGAVVFSSNAQKATIGSTVMEPVFSVSTNQDSWSATSDKEWLSVKIDKASGRFTLSAKPNPDVSSLPTASVTVLVNDTLKMVIPVSQLSFGIENSELAPIALVLGRGYDVTGSYARSEEIKAAVLDFSELHSNNLVKRNPNLRKSTSSTYASESVSEVSQQLKTSVGLSTKAGVEGIGSFQQEFAASFGMNRIETNEYAVAITRHDIIRDAYVVEYTDYARLSQYVTPSFLEDLANKTPNDIIQLYGTHVMLGGMWGARLEKNVWAKKKARGFGTSASASFSAKAEGTIKQITLGAGASAEVNSKYDDYFYSMENDKKTYALGGDPEFAVNIHNSNDYEKWLNSVAGNEVWCNYYENSLVPIYELVADAKDRQLLKDAFDKYIDGKTINVVNVLKFGQKEVSLTAISGATRIGGGDSDIGSQKNKGTSYDLKIDLRENIMNRNVDVTFNYTVTELKKNNTKLQLITTLPIHIGKKDFALTGSTTWTDGNKIMHENHGWNNINTTECPFLKSAQVKIDGKGGDENNIGVQGVFIINYSYLE